MAAQRISAVFLGAVLALLAAGCSRGLPGGIDPLPSGPTGPGLAADDSIIQVLSNRSDMLSDGDALVEIVMKGEASAAKVLLNGADVSSQFALRPNGRYMGLLKGMKLGANTLTASLNGTDISGSATLVNYPNEGPIFSGPRIARLSCQEGAVDAYCNKPAEYTLMYKSTNLLKIGLQPYDPASPPTDIATATTDEGVTMPFIVRQELGYQDRDQYKILTLYTQGEDWTAWEPQKQWNHKLLITHGGNCGASYTPGTAPTDDYSGTIPATPVFEQSYIRALGRGFMVMTTALGNTGHNCDIPLGAEAMMMAKERLVEQYGTLRYTIGTGCSGGSIAQATIANSYPGIYQGLLTMCAYPDTFSAGLQFTDLHLMRAYFENPLNWSVTALWNPLQFGLVEGHLTHLNAITSDELLYKAATSPTGDCYGPNSYDPVNNPGGVRCGIIDWMPEIFGERDPSVWSPMEQAAGKSFTGLPLGNAGVQYGLTLLQQGLITTEQFVDLNAKIGGLDIDIQPTAARSRADHPAVENAYRSGTINMTNNMKSVAIINFVGPDPGIAHDTVHAFWVRWRLEREQGHHDNHVMWAGVVPLIGDLNDVYTGLTAMDEWLSAVEQDTSDKPLSEKIIADRPGDVTDRCTNGLGEQLIGEACVDLLRPLYAYGTPRTVAGADKTSDDLECVLKPLNREDDYGLIPFTDAQWALMEATFPDGVCDYSQTSVGKQPTIPWLTYQDGAGKMIVGGRPIAAKPANSRGGWNSGAFVYP